MRGMRCFLGFRQVAMKIAFLPGGNTAGLMQDFRQAAGVLRRSFATCRVAATIPALSARLVENSGNGVLSMISNARRVPLHVRKSFAVNSASMISWR